MECYATPWSHVLFHLKQMSHILQKNFPLKKMMMSQIESFLANSLHNTRMRQKECQIICWRLLWAFNLQSYVLRVNQKQKVLVSSQPWLGPCTKCLAQAKKWTRPSSILIKRGTVQKRGEIENVTHLYFFILDKNLVVC